METTSNSPAEKENDVLQARIGELESELSDLQLLHEMVVDHGTELENELIELVEILSRVATDLEKGIFDPASLKTLIDRPDELGQLGRAFQAMGQEVSARDRRLRMLRVVIPAGVALSAEKDYGRLLETIVVEAQQLCNADGGSLYLISEDKKLEAVIVRNDSLALTMGGTSENKVTFSPIPIYNDQNKPNVKNLVSRVALSRELINISDVYKRDGKAISAVKAFDKKFDYHSKSFLAIPLKDENEEVIGVLQLINAKDRNSGDVVPFVMDDVLEALVLLGSAALSGYMREESLRQEIEKLHIQIDVVRRDQEVAGILESDYFQELQQRAKEMREKRASRQ
jgi:hypothetical protein